MLPDHWKAERHWNRLCRCEIFLTHEMNLLPVQNPCKAELHQSEGNFLFLENTDFQHIHSVQQHFLVLKTGKDCN